MGRPCSSTKTYFFVLPVVRQNSATLNFVRVTMLQASPHCLSFQTDLNFGEGVGSAYSCKCSSPGLRERARLTSLWQRCIRTLTPLRLQFQLNVRTIHPDFVGAHPLRRRRTEHLAGAELELGAMPGTSDLVAFKLPL